jgi:hypothetical protein
MDMDFGMDIGMEAEVVILLERFSTGMELDLVGG